MILGESIFVFSCSLLLECKVISEDCDGEITEETPAADTQLELAVESTEEDSSTQNSSKKKKKKRKMKRKLNEAEDLTNLCEFFFECHVLQPAL